MRKVIQQWRILTTVFPHIFILYCLSQCVYLHVSNPFTTSTVTISGQVHSVRHDQVWVSSSVAPSGEVLTLQQ